MKESEDSRGLEMSDGGFREAWRVQKMGNRYQCKDYEGSLGVENPWHRFLGFPFPQVGNLKLGKTSCLSGGRGTGMWKPRKVMKDLWRILR